MESDLRNIAEAVLFTMGKSVDLSQLAAAMGVSKDTAEKTVLALQKEYDEEMRGIQIIRLNDDQEQAFLLIRHGLMILMFLDKTTRIAM